MSTSVKIRAKAKGDMVVIKALWSHPMETGLRKNKDTGELIPANFINHIKCESAGKEIMNADWNATISKDPYLSFSYKGNKGDEFKISWADSTGETGEKATKVK